MRPIVLGSFLAIFLVGAMAMPAAAASPSGMDITTTTSGQAAAKLAAARLTSVGHPTKASDLAVYSEADGSVSAMPRGLERTYGQRHDGSFGPGVVLRAPSAVKAPSSSVASAAAPMAAQYWNQINNGCLYKTKSQGWMYSCWSLKKMFNDGYPNNDFFIVSFDGKAHSNDSGMHVAYVETTKNSSSASFMVVDWSPASNYTGNCRSTYIGVSYILYWAMTVTECENWLVSADPIGHPGTQVTEWLVIGTIYNDTREPAMVQEVETAQNASPIWNLYYDFQ